MIFGSEWASVGVLIFAVLGSSYAILAFAHVRIDNCDMKELARLRAEGVLPERVELIGDFVKIHRKLDEIAPAVYLRQEFWIQLYFQVLRLAHAMEWHTGFVERELMKLSAYQANHYRTALIRMERLQNPAL
jgi:hypothetical protein